MVKVFNFFGYFDFHNHYFENFSVIVLIHYEECQVETEKHNDLQENLENVFT